MKTRFLLTSLMILFLGFAQAQDFGGMLTSIANGIKPEAFKGGWSKMKDKWLADAATLDPTNLKGSGDQIAGLVKNLKGSAFSPDAKGLQKDLLGNLANLSSPGKLGETLSSLVSGLDPSMLTSDFLSKKDGILSGLKMLQ
jgi:hypothetical protein